MVPGKIATRLEQLEARLVLDAMPLINEIMAANDSTLADENGDYVDWIEIYNAGDGNAELGGFFLTDQANVLDKWQLPPTQLAPGDHLVVFASGKDRATSRSQLHTNFSLDADGEYLALVEPDGNTLASEFSPQFPPQFEDVSYGSLTANADEVLVPHGAAVRVLVPRRAGDLVDNAVAWQDSDFNDPSAAGWLDANSGIGFDLSDSANVGPLINPAGDLQAHMYGTNASVLTRFPFQVDDPSRFETLRLEVDYNDGYVAYLKGTEVARQNAPVGNLAFDSSAPGLSESLLNQYYAALPSGGGSANITTTASSNGGGPAGEAGSAGTYGSDKLVDGNFFSPDPGAGDVGGELQASGFYGHTTDPDLYMWFMAGPLFQSLAINEQYVSFSFADGPHVFPSMRVWNYNELTPGNKSNQTDRGVRDMWVWYSNNPTLPTITGAPGAASPGAGWTLDRKVTLPQAPGTGTYDGVNVDLGSFTAQHVLLMIDSNHGDPGYAGLSEVQLFRTGGVAVQQDQWDISQYVEKLVQGENILAIQGLNIDAADNDFLLRPRLSANDPNRLHSVETFITNPTPGDVNTPGTSDQGPFIIDVIHTPATPTDDDDLLVTARITEKFTNISEVSLHYRVMFDSEVTVLMFDDGLHGDSVAGDGIYGATIPGRLSAAGQMVRYYITADDVAGNLSRGPLFPDPNRTPEYFGTVIEDPTIQSNLPVLHWFLQNVSAANTRNGTPASIFYAGQFHDNIQVDLHGQYSADFFPKKAYDFKLNSADPLTYESGAPRIRDFNLLTNWADKSKIRNTMSYEVFRSAGSPYFRAFPVRVQQNGQFFSVADFVEEGDEAFLERLGLDPNGALYKMENPLTSTNQADKKTRLEEGKSDLQALIHGSSQNGQSRTNFFFDNINLPEVINYLASMVIASNHDCCHKNYYVYRDSEGTGEWQVFPWDVNLSFGHRFTSNSSHFDDKLYFTNPLWIGSPAAFTSPTENVLITPLYETPAIREMYLRRLRTLMDELLQPPGTYSAELKMEQRLDELVTWLDPNDDPNPNLGTDDADLDRQKWGTWGNGDTMRQAVNRIKEEFLPGRRDFLFRRLNVSNGGEIPDAQQGNPIIQFGTIDFNPASGNQDEEYIELENPYPVAVDISGWHLEGGIQHTFQPGVVIPAGSALYVSPNVNVFRARTVGPSGGQGLFVQGNYEGNLSNFGETVNLVAKDGSLISTVTLPTVPTDNQQFLRISELHFNPAGEDLTEFIEVTNIGSGAESMTLDLTDVVISDGPSLPFMFAPGTLLAPGEFLVVVKDQAVFQAAYPGVSSSKIVGPFQGSLSNGGERIRLADAAGGTIIEFTYGDSDPWPVRADGAGGSLELVDPAGTPVDQLHKHYHWRGSTPFGGSPGVAGTGSIGIVVNEVLSATDSPVPQSDSIELYNSTANPIAIGGWFLSDSSANFLKFEISAGTTISAGGYVVFDESDFNANPGNLAAIDFALSGTNGDDVWLVIPDGAGGIESFVDDVHFPAAANGEALGRLPEGVGRYSPLQTPSLGSANAAARIGPVVISELQYHPDRPSTAALAMDPMLTRDDLEFIEIHNPTGMAVDLTGWRIRGGVDFDFAAGTLIGSGQTLVVISFDLEEVASANRLAAFREHYGIAASVALVGSYAGRLSDSDELLVLQRPGSPSPEDPTRLPRWIEDELLYDDRLPWPVVADGGGHSLHRTRSTGLGSEATSWTPSVPHPGSPVRSGDVDLDGDVDTSDLTTAIINFTGAGGAEKTWSDGDIDGDGDVDTGDLTQAIISFTGALAGPVVAGRGGVSAVVSDVPQIRLSESRLIHTGDEVLASDDSQRGQVQNDPGRSPLLAGKVGRLATRVDPRRMLDLTLALEDRWTLLLS